MPIQEQTLQTQWPAEKENDGRCALCLPQSKARASSQGQVKGVQHQKILTGRLRDEVRHADKKWKPVPRRYFLVGCGATYPVSSQNQIPKWLGPGALAVEGAARIVTCEKQRGVTAIEQEMRDSGRVALCATCSDIHSRFVTAISATWPGGASVQGP